LSAADERPAMTDRDDRTATGGLGVDADGAAETDPAPSPEREPLEPGTPDPEHAAFVLVGVVATLAVLYVGLVGGP
jgi:hypothetical protein